MCAVVCVLCAFVGVCVRLCAFVCGCVRVLVGAQKRAKIVLKNPLYASVTSVSRCHFDIKKIKTFQKFDKFFGKLYCLGKLPVEIFFNRKNLGFDYF